MGQCQDGIVRISELSERSGVSVPTIKYYLRERLLYPGTATSVTGATYDDRHTERLWLIRALVDVGGMSLDRVRDVLACVDDQTADLHTALGAAHEQLSGEPKNEPSAASTAACDELIRQRDWQITADSRHVRALATSLDTMADAGIPITDAMLGGYADAAELIAETEIDPMPLTGRDVSATYAVTGTVLAEPVLLAIRRIAHESLSARRFGSRPISHPGHNSGVTPTPEGD